VLTVTGVLGDKAGSSSGQDCTRAWLVLLVPSLGRLKLEDSPATCDDRPAGAVRCEDSAAAAAEAIGSVILRGVVARFEGRDRSDGRSGIGVGPTIVDDLFRLRGDTGGSRLSLIREILSL
jgi:hypothetical protein